MEKNERGRRWHTIDEAASAVEEPMLRLLILQLGDQLTEASNPA